MPRNSVPRAVCVQVSVEDVSNKASMLLRLLYSAAHMCTWYGKWGYGFGRAAFNYGAEEYEAAVKAIHAAPLSALVKDMEVRGAAGSGGGGARERLGTRV